MSKVSKHREARIRARREKALKRRIEKARAKFFTQHPLSPIFSTPAIKPSLWQKFKKILGFNDEID